VSRAGDKIERGRRIVDALSGKRFPWRAFLGLTAIAAVGLALSFPPPPPPATFAAGLLVLAAMVASGLRLGRAAGLEPSLLVRRHDDAAHRAIPGLAVGALAGLALGAAILLWLRLSPGNALIRSDFATQSASPEWQRWIVAFDAAVLEETGFRLFTVSLLLWLVSRTWLPSARWPAARRAWLSITAVALAFGFAHLPKWLAVAPASIGLVTSVLILNASGGMVFGYLYWRRGIEAAMVGHFAADVVLHVLGPVLFRG
jgi:hypothetical protein